MNTQTRTLKLTLAGALALLGTLAGTARADEAAEARADIQRTLGFEPGFLKAIPDLALPGIWQQIKGLEMNPGTALPGKVKELIGVAVAAQIPCTYCVYSHTEFAKVNGAGADEIGEAVMLAALTREASTFMNGIQLDMAKFRAEINQLVGSFKKMAAAGSPPPALKPIAVVDAKSALQDIKQTFGFAPDFLTKIPAEMLPGVWNLMKAVEMNPNTKLPGKYKSLIGLAVASQIPCHYCIVADTEFAKLEGATDREIAEAVAMASLTRGGSTALNGLQVDAAGYRKDIDRLVAGARKHAMAGRGGKNR